MSGWVGEGVGWLREMVFTVSCSCIIVLYYYNSVFGWCFGCFRYRGISVANPRSLQARSLIQISGLHTRNSDDCVHGPSRELTTHSNALLVVRASEGLCYW